MPFDGSYVVARAQGGQTMDLLCEEGFPLLEGAKILRSIASYSTSFPHFISLFIPHSNGNEKGFLKETFTERYHPKAA